jgi:signal peptidase I
VADVRAVLARRMAAEQRAHLVREVVETILLTALIFAVVHFAVQTFRVQGPSMEPGLHDNQYLLVNSLAYVFGQPHRGDVIVFHHTASLDYVKRVIAIPGDTIEITATQVIVDGVVLNEPYIPVPPGASQSPQVLPKEKIGPNQYFVIGDNRLNSSDSRFWGPVPRQEIVGRVVMVFWPMDQIHWLPNYSNVFDSVKP